MTDQSRFFAALERCQAAQQQEPEPEQLPDFWKMLRRLKKDYLQNVMPSLRRHSYAMTRGERRRLQKEKSIKRLKRAEARQRRAAARFIRQKMRGK